MVNFFSRYITQYFQNRSKKYFTFFLLFDIANKKKANEHEFKLAARF